jgi:hypothetical protein
MRANRCFCFGGCYEDIAILSSYFLLRPSHVDSPAERAAVVVVDSRFESDSLITLAPGGNFPPTRSASARPTGSIFVVGKSILDEKEEH